MKKLLRKIVFWALDLDIDYLYSGDIYPEVEGFSGVRLPIIITTYVNTKENIKKKEFRREVRGLTGI